MTLFDDITGEAQEIYKKAKEKVEVLLPNEVTAKMQEEAIKYDAHFFPKLELTEEGTFKDFPALQAVLHDFSIQVKDSPLNLETWEAFVRSCPEAFKKYFETCTLEKTQEQVLTVLRSLNKELLLAGETDPEETTKVLGSGFDTTLKVMGAFGLGGLAYYGVKSLYARFFDGKEPDTPILSSVLFATTVGAFLGKDKINEYLLSKNVDLDADNLAKMAEDISKGEIMSAFDRLTSQYWTRETRAISGKNHLEKELVCNFAPVSVQDILKEHDTFLARMKAEGQSTVKDGLKQVGVDVDRKVTQTALSVVLGKDVNLTDTASLVKYIKDKKELYQEDEKITLLELMKRDFAQTQG